MCIHSSNGKLPTLGGFENEISKDLGSFLAGGRGAVDIHLGEDSKPPQDAKQKNAFPKIEIYKSERAIFLKRISNNTFNYLPKHAVSQSTETAPPQGTMGVVALWIREHKPQFDELLAHLISYPSVAADPNHLEEQFPPSDLATWAQLDKYQPYPYTHRLRSRIEPWRTAMVAKIGRGAPFPVIELI